MFRKLFLAAAGLLAAAAVGYAQQPFPGDSARTLICGMPYLQNMTPDGVSVMFQSTCSVHSWVEVGRDSLHVDTVRQLFCGQEVVHDAEHRIRLNGLTPGATYYYRVCTQKIELNQAYKKVFGRTERTPFRRFTLPTDTATHFTLLVFNDMHCQPQVMDAMARLAAQTPHDLVIFNGDCLPEPRDRQEAIANIQNLVRRFDAGQNPCVFMRGNHEIRNAYSSGMPTLFDYGTDGETYHTIRWGDTYLVMLDCGEDKPDNTWVYYGLNDFDAFRKAQADFLEKTIATREYRKAKRHIVVHHIPLWFSHEDKDPGGASRFCRALWTDVLTKAKVDLGINGHTHRFEYYEPGQQGNLYPTIIGGGPSLKSATMTVVEKRGKVLRVKAVNANGETVFEKTL